jgi:dipeptidyl-peptidase-4
MRKLFVLLFLLPMVAIAQRKQITLEDIYKKGTFRGELAPAFAGESVDSLVNPADVKDENGKVIPLSDHVLSSDKKRFLVFTNREQIYRRSAKYNVYLHDIIAKRTRKLDSEKIMHPTFSPDGSRIAFVKNNNLYLYDIATNSARAITTDGKWNHIINGNCDWVYEEEFEFTRAYEWSPKGSYIAYYRFDETNVKEYQFTQFDNAIISSIPINIPRQAKRTPKWRSTFMISPITRM